MPLAQHVISAAWVELKRSEKRISGHRAFPPDASMFSREAFKRPQIVVLTNQLPPEKLPSSNSDDFRPVAHNSEEEETIWPTDKWPTTNTAPPNIGNGADATAAALDQRLALAFCTAEESAKENRCPYIEIRPSPSGTHPQRKAEQPPSTGASMPGGGVAGGANSPQHQQQQEHHGRGSGGLDIDLEQVLRSESARAPFHVRDSAGLFKI